MARSDFPPVGAWVTFTCGRDSLALGVPTPVDSVFDPVAQTVAGKVVSVKPMAPFGPGKIPTAAVTIKGRSGKVVTIDGAAMRLKVWDSEEQALAAINRTNAARSQLTAARTP